MKDKELHDQAVLAALTGILAEGVLYKDGAVLAAFEHADKFMAEREKRRNRDA